VRDHVRQLSAGVAIYGAGDAAISVVNFLLLPAYIRFLTRDDYGALLILISIETFAKIINRWGLDGAFMRYFLDRDEGRPQQQLASTILLFMLGLDGALLFAALSFARPITAHLFADLRYLPALRLMLVNTFLVAFTFVPFHVMRLKQQARPYSALTFTRSAGTTILRLVFVMAAGLGVTGLYLADLIVTVVILLLLWRWFRPLVRPLFSVSELRQALRFGLPRLPHGLAQQAFDYGNRLLLTRYVPLAELGVYQNASTLGTGVKFFLSSFETAWAPFYYATARRPDAKAVLAKMTTYGAAVLVLLVAGTAAVAHDIVLVMLNAEYVRAVTIVPVVALALAFQGVYLLTSIGLNLSGHTEYYPLSTFAAAVVGLGSGFALMPHLGALGAAVALLLSFVTQAAVAFACSQHFYPMRYEVGRLVRVAAAGATACAAGLWLVPAWPPFVGFLTRGTLTVAVYVGVLAATGFFRETEIAFLREQWKVMSRRLARRTALGDAAD
jgi:O-antigen/teichoic acid export membrane protein